MKPWTVSDKRSRCQGGSVSERPSNEAMQPTKAAFARIEAVFAAERRCSVGESQGEPSWRTE